MTYERLMAAANRAAADAIRWRPKPGSANDGRLAAIRAQDARTLRAMASASLRL